MLWVPFPSCFLWAYQSVTSAQMLLFINVECRLLAGVSATPFQELQKHLAANGVKPCSLPISIIQIGKAQQQSHGVTALSYSTQTAGGSTGDMLSALESLARQRCSWMKREAVGSSFHTTFSAGASSSWPWTGLTTEFKSRRKSLFLTFGLCFSSNLLQAWSTSHMLYFLLRHEAF